MQTWHTLAVCHVFEEFSDMGKYMISDEGRHYLDAILPTFCFPNRINSFGSSIKEVLASEKGDISDDNVLRLRLLIQEFLSRNRFGHPEDYIFIIDEKGMKLKECGSLAAYEEKENNLSNSI